MGSHELFMLRVWHRASARDYPWIGRLEHLPDGTIWIARSPQDMLALLAPLLESGLTASDRVVEAGRPEPVDGETGMDQAAAGSEGRHKHVDASVPQEHGTVDK